MFSFQGEATLLFYIFYYVRLLTTIIIDHCVRAPVRGVIFPLRNLSSEEVIDLTEVGLVLRDASR